MLEILSPQRLRTYSRYRTRSPASLDMYVEAASRYLLDLKTHALSSPFVWANFIASPIVLNSLVSGAKMPIDLWRSSDQARSFSNLSKNLQPPTTRCPPLR